MVKVSPEAHPEKEEHEAVKALTLNVINMNATTAEGAREREKRESGRGNLCERKWVLRGRTSTCRAITSLSLLKKEAQTALKEGE